MAIRLEFDANGVARIVAAGVLSYEDTVTALEQLYQDARFRTPTRLLWDLRSGRAKMSFEEIRRIASFVRKNRPEGRGRTAIVADDDLSFGMSRMYELTADNRDVDVHVFRDAKAALDWLLENF